MVRRGGRRAGPARRRRGSAVQVALGLLIVIAGIAVLVFASQARAGGPVFGVLEADPTWWVSDTSAGIRLATISVDWSQWEPEANTYDQAYQARMVETLNLYRGAGWQVAVDIGLQSPPQWVLSLPGGRLVDEFGNRSHTADFEFSSSVREAGSNYVAHVVDALGAVRYYRVGLSDSGEALYPSVVKDGWWAFSAQAQDSSPGLPNGVSPTPMIGWIPGSSTWKGKAVSSAQVTAWYDWYFGAMANALAWEIAAYRSAGFQGSLQLVMPGTGTTVEAYTSRLAHDLATSHDLDPYDTLNTAAVWWRLLDALPDLRHVVVDISSVGDGSGTAKAATCRSSDSKVDYRADPSVAQWSDTRWLTYLARAHKLPVVGENPGNNQASDLPGIFSLVKSCHLGALQWAFDYQLHEGGYVTIGEYAAAIQKAR